jgi:hypothetical protein
VVPPGDPEALAVALEEALAGDPGARARRAAGAAGLARSFAWERVLEPLIEFCRAPRQDPTKEGFAFRPATVAPPDGLGFRLRRRLRRSLRGGGGR